MKPGPFIRRLVRVVSLPLFRWRAIRIACPHPQLDQLLCCFAQCLCCALRAGRSADFADLNLHRSRVFGRCAVANATKVRLLFWCPMILLVGCSGSLCSLVLVPRPFTGTRSDLLMVACHKFTPSSHMCVYALGFGTQSTLHPSHTQTPLTWCARARHRPSWLV